MLCSSDPGHGLPSINPSLAPLPMSYAWMLHERFFQMIPRHVFVTGYLVLYREAHLASLSGPPVCSQSQKKQPFHFV